jgi:hypothetical protein
VGVVPDPSSDCFSISFNESDDAASWTLDWQSGFVWDEIQSNPTIYRAIQVIFQQKKKKIFSQKKIKKKKIDFFFLPKNKNKFDFFFFMLT